MPADQVWKTLVARGDRSGVMFAVIPGDAELDLRAVAAATGDRRVELVPLREVHPLTGYIRGGVTALAARRDHAVFVDELIEAHARIAVSAGVRGTQIVLSPADYVRATGAMVGAIATFRAAK